MFLCKSKSPREAERPERECLTESRPLGLDSSVGFYGFPCPNRAENHRMTSMPDSRRWSQVDGIGGCPSLPAGTATKNQVLPFPKLGDIDLLELKHNPRARVRVSN